VKIFIATHKEFLSPDDYRYIPIHVGSAGSDLMLNGQSDSIEDNISEKNPTFCELTGLYWIWKNYDLEGYVGLCHYRRFFLFRKLGRTVMKRLVYNHSDFYRLRNSLNINFKVFNGYDIVLSEPVYLGGLSIYEHYCLFNRGSDLDTMAEVLFEKYPAYERSYKFFVHSSKELSPYNMFISSKRIMNDYCEWLFDILFEVEKRVCVIDDPYQARVFGFLAERMLPLYAFHNNLKVKYLPVVRIDELSSVSHDLESMIKDSLKRFVLRYNL